jgi:replicative DNA helicase
MARFSLGVKGQAIHLAIEGSVGGTSMALHLAANAIEEGGRVIWASKEMPNAGRFSQLFSHLSLVQSSRFHAMNLSGKMELAVPLIVQAMNSLPSVSMIILDDWCDSSGRISKDELSQVAKLLEQKKEDVTLLLVSKGGIDVTGNSGDSIVVRSANVMRKSGFTIATMTREKDGPFRTLKIGDNISKIKLEQSGFTLL